MAKLELFLLGAPQIHVDGQAVTGFNTRKDQALLAYLAVTGTAHSRETLAGLLWSELPEEKARRNLRHSLSHLQKVISPQWLATERGVALTREQPWSVDVHTLRAAVQKLTASPQVATERNNTPTVDAVDAVLQLYRGEFLQGFHLHQAAHFEEWVLAQREELRLLTMRGLEAAAQRYLAQGAYEPGLTVTRRLLQLEPWSEAAHCLQMQLLAQSGRRAEALAQYEHCRQILAAELDVEPDAETVRLYEQIKRGRSFARQGAAIEARTPQPAQPTAVRHNLPRQLTSLIGRVSDIDAIQRLFNEESMALLTLVGPGGAGKTRLALAVAQQLRTHAPELFPDGIWFVPLAGIAPGVNATEQIAGAIAQAMDLSLTGADPLAKQISRALQGQQLLLVLDNFEQLIAEQAFLLELVQTAQQVKVLVTSREQLQLHAGFLYPVIGLPVPLAHQLRRTEEHTLLTAPDPAQQNRFRSSRDMGQYASVQLFVTRVQQRLPEFHLTTQNQHTIGLICRLLGGVPLGIELAAQLYVEQGIAALTQLITEIEQLDPLERRAQSAALGLDHLQTAVIDLPARQRSMRAVFDHSWRLLTAAEQDLLRHCAIFRGGFTREAILTVAGGDGANLLALVMKSLVRRDSHDRYDLHELVRQYVIDQFQQKPTVVHASARKHAAYFIDLLAGQEEKLLQESVFHETIQTEIYNIRAAWAWYVDQPAIAELERCVVCLFIYLRYAGQVHEALAFATQVITRLRSLPKEEYSGRPHNRLLGYLLIYAASAGIGAGLMEESEQWLQEALQLGEALADPGLLGQIYATFMIRSSLGLENHRLMDYAQKALHWVKEGNILHLQPVILRVLGIGLACHGKIEESFQVKAELQQLIQTRHYHCIAGESFYLASTLYEIQRDWEAELTTAQQGWALCQEGGHMFGLDNLEGNLIWANLQLGNFAQARELALGFGQRARRTGKQAELLYSLQSSGEAEIGLGHWQAGESYLAEALKLAMAINSTIRRVFIRHQLGNLSICQKAYDQAAAHFQDALQCAKTVDAFDLQILAQAGLALTYLRQGKLAQALLEVESFLGAEQRVTLDSPDYCFVGLVIYQVLAVHQDPRAEAILDQLYNDVQTQAAKIRKDAQRTIFLENIREHREIVALWEAKEANQQ